MLAGMDMVIDYFIATILICGAPDDCTYYYDKLGPTSSRVECHLRIDKLWWRVLKNKDVAIKFPKMGRKQFDHQGFCFDNLKKNRPAGWREFWYER